MRFQHFLAGTTSVSGCGFCFADEAPPWSGRGWVIEAESFLFYVIRVLKLCGLRSVLREVFSKHHEFRIVASLEPAALQVSSQRLLRFSPLVLRALSGCFSLLN